MSTSRGVAIAVQDCQRFIKHLRTFVWMVVEPGYEWELLLSGRDDMYGFRLLSSHYQTKDAEQYEEIHIEC